MNRLLLLGVLAGCGDNVADPRAAHGGRRLKLITYVYEDGTREYDREAFYDAQRQERCRPQLYSDRARYCMPDTAAGNTVFTDSTCTTALGSELPGHPVPAYFIRYFSLHGDELPSRIYPSGARVSPPPQVWEQRDGHCIGPISPANAWYYELGEEVTPSQLVRIRESGLLEGERLAVGIDTTLDELRVPGAFYDRRVTRGCEMTPRANGADASCIPDDLQYASYYADEHCTEPLIALPRGQSADVVKHFAHATGCWSLFHVGGELAPPEILYEQLGASCVAVPTPVGQDFYATGPAIDIASAARVVQPSAGRLAQVELVHGPVRVPDDFLFDTELGAECKRRDRDGEVACEPHAAVGVQTVFADAGCAITLRLAFVPVGACHAPARFATDGDDIHPIGAPYTETFYELEPGDSCGTYVAPPGFVARSLGPAMTPAQFARATVEYD